MLSVDLSNAITSNIKATLSGLFKRLLELEPAVRFNPYV